MVLYGDELNHLHHLVFVERKFAPQYITEGGMQDTRHPVSLLPHKAQTGQNELDCGFGWSALQPVQGETNYFFSFDRPYGSSTRQLTADLCQHTRDEIRLRHNFSRR